MYIIVSLLLLLPPTLMFSLSIVLTLVGGEVGGIAMLVVASYSFLCLWKVFFDASLKRSAKLSWPLWLGVVLTPMSGAWMLYLFFDGQLGGFDQVYYFSLAPTIYATLSIYRSIRGCNEGAKKPSKQARSLFSRVLLWLSYLCFFSVFAFVFVAMAGTLMVRGYGAVGDLLSPLNWVNWVMMILLAMPALLLHKFSSRGDMK
ncbi:hypothetical protein A9Q99_01715 [Gammaproteobacteria bacterium 45_16_T64]|nr:hypothetical protein A9Q99_01715 [Gammaproteobacteria bacterium 45_16_T64]